MLNIHVNVEDFKGFVENIHEKLYGQKLEYDKLSIDFDILILNKDKYTVDDIQEYIEFYKYKPISKEKKLSIINNFDLIDIKSQNKLLKLFEENQENHILTTNNVNKILSTIKSRAIVYKEDNKIKSFENYPKRYWDVIRLIDSKIDNTEIDFYLKIYDLFSNAQYQQAYIKLITVENYDEQTIYEIVQYTHSKFGQMDVLLQLQQRLFTKTNKKLQIENYLLQRIRLNGSN